MMLVLLAGGCGGVGVRAAGPATPTDTRAAAAPAVAAPKGSTAAPSPARPEPTKASAGPATASTAVPTKAPTTGSAPASAKALLLEVDAPAEDTVVEDPTLAVRGRTIPEAVVSVDGDLVEVGRDGSFSTQVQLEEGANDLEVVASDPAGNEQYVLRSVIYEP